MDYRQIVRQGYDAIVEEYLAVRSQLHPRDVELLDELVRRLPEGARVLDAGCGAGVPVTRILSQHFRVVGVDFSEEQVRRARELVPGAELVCADMTRLGFAEASFDAICSYYAIIHVPRDKHWPLLLDFCRLLKPSGLALLCMGAGDIDVDIAEDFFGARMYWSHYDRETNMKMLQECGFHVIWSKLITEQYEFGSGKHLFVLAEKG